LGKLWVNFETLGTVLLTIYGEKFTIYCQQNRQTVTKQPAFLTHPARRPRPHPFSEAEKASQKPAQSIENTSKKHLNMV